VGHHFGAAREDEIGVACKDGLRGKVDGLLAGAAHAVEADGGDMDGEARFEDAEPRQVAALIAEGGDDAPDGVIEAGGADARTFDGFAHDEGGQFDRLEGVEGTRLFACGNGGADGGDDEDVGIGHGKFLVDFWREVSVICIEVLYRDFAAQKELDILNSDLILRRRYGFELDLGIFSVLAASICIIGINSLVATSKWIEFWIGFFGWAIFHNIYFLIGSGLGIFSIDSIVVVLIFAVSPFLIGSWFLISKKNLWRGIGCVMAILTSALIFRFSYGHPNLLTIFLPYPGGVYFLMDAFMF
jgi:hypothetical protein